MFSSTFEATMLCTDEIEPSGPDLVAPAPPGALGPASPTTRELDDAYKFQELAALRTAHETLRADHEELLAAVRALQASRVESLDDNDDDARSAASPRAPRGSKVLGAVLSEPAGGGDDFNAHTHLIIAATAPGATAARAVRCIGASLLLVLLQSMVMVAVLVETSFPRCASDDDCRAGTFCAPTTFWAAWNPGMCVDCDLAPSLAGDRWPGDDAVYPKASFADAVDAMPLADRRASLAHCNATDAMPGRCDQLVLDRAVLSWASLIVLGFVVALVMLPLLQDLHESAREHELFAQRADGLAHLPRRRAVVRNLHEMAQHTRQLVLPALVVGTTAGLLVSGPMSATNILLNGLAVGFATSVDEIFAMVFRTRETAAAAAAAFDAIAEQDARFRRTSESGAVARRDQDLRRTRHAHTAFIGSLTLVLLALLLETEQLMTFGPVLAFPGDPGRPSYKLCGDVINPILFLPMWCAMIAGFVFPLVGHHRLVTLVDGLKGVVCCALVINMLMWPVMFLNLAPGVGGRGEVAI